MSCEEHERTLRDVKAHTFQGASSPRINLGDVEEFDHGICGKGNLTSCRVFKLPTAKLSVKALMQESGC